LANRVYELMYIAVPESTEEEVAALTEGISKSFTEQGGTVLRIDNMGKRRMAYEINKKREGHYVLFELEGTGKEILEVERRMRINDAIIRFVTVRVDEERKTAAKIVAKREARIARRAAFKPSEVEEVSIEKIVEEEGE
jgi:small subunit ribosomal protein S6